MRKEREMLKEKKLQLHTTGHEERSIDRRTNISIKSAQMPENDLQTNKQASLII